MTEVKERPAVRPEMESTAYGASDGFRGYRTLTWRRFLTALGLVLTLPLIIAVLALTYRPPEPAPVESAPDLEPLSSVLYPLTQAHLERSRLVFRMVKDLTAPTLIAAADVAGAPPGGLPTLVLVPREQPYTLQEVRALVPDAFRDLPGQGVADAALLLTANLQVPAGASLVIDAQTPDLRMMSTAAGFASLISRGNLRVEGDREHPVRVSSWDPDRGAPDRDLADGRSFVLQSGGRLDARYGVFENLGFNLGVSSGVAWNSSPDVDPAQRVRARGDVTSSVFRSNYFGAYTREAEGMAWVGNTFADNAEYGFDPHDFSNNFLVTDNVAYGNGKHGFIFSHGCSGNILLGNYSHDNAGHGFMIDDGRSTSTEAEPQRILGSDNNLLVANFAYGNGGSGIEIEGGSGNVVTENRLAGNYVGVRGKNDASVSLRDNTILDNRRYGIDVVHSSSVVTITANRISGGWGGVNLAAVDHAVLAANTIEEVSAPLVVDGVAIRQPSRFDQVALFVRWHPMTVLWTLLLGVPIVVVGTRLARAAVRHGRSGIRRLGQRAGG